ncbi:hypothetical protein D3C86_1746930 [compost metagenome]
MQAVIGAGSRLIAGSKERLGIRSPSRVFAGFGDDTMAGLTRGLDRSAGAPLASVGRTAAALAAAGAVTATAGFAVAEAPAFDTGPRIGPGSSAAMGGGSGGGQRSAPTVSNHYEIHVHAGPGMDLEALARMMLEKITELERQKNLAALGDQGENWS